MPRKKVDDSLFGTEYQEDKREKLPTLQQYVKLNPSAKDTVSDIDIIWFPGRFKNFTLQTTVLRASVQPANRLFGAIQSRIDEILDYDSGISLTITATKPISFVLNRNEVVGVWERLGDSGIKFKPNESEGVDDSPW